VAELKGYGDRDNLIAAGSLVGRESAVKQVWLGL